MKDLAVACRNSLLLMLFLGMFGDVQGRAQLYWVAVFCSLAYTFARTSREMVGMSIAEPVSSATDSY